MMRCAYIILFVHFFIFVSLSLSVAVWGADLGWCESELDGVCLEKRISDSKIVESAFGQLFVAL